MAGTTFSFPNARLLGCHSSAISLSFAFSNSFVIRAIAVGLVLLAGIPIETANWAVVPGFRIANRKVIPNRLRRVREQDGELCGIGLATLIKPQFRRWCGLPSPGWLA